MACFGNSERQKINGHIAVIPFVIYVFVLRKQAKVILVNGLCFKLDWALRHTGLASGAQFKSLSLGVTLDHQLLNNVLHRACGVPRSSWPWPWKESRVRIIPAPRRPVLANTFTP